MTLSALDNVYNFQSALPKIVNSKSRWSASGRWPFSRTVMIIVGCVSITGVIVAFLKSRTQSKPITKSVEILLQRDETRDLKTFSATGSKPSSTDPVISLESTSQSVHFSESGSLTIKSSLPTPVPLKTPSNPRVATSRLYSHTLSTQAKARDPRASDSSTKPKVFPKTVCTSNPNRANRSSATSCTSTSPALSFRPDGDLKPVRVCADAEAWMGSKSWVGYTDQAQQSVNDWVVNHYLNGKSIPDALSLKDIRKVVAFCKIYGGTDSEPLLLEAILSKDSDIVRSLCALGFDTECLSLSGRTILMRAARLLRLDTQSDRSYITTMEFLLKAGANPNAGDENGWTPLSLAVGYDQLEGVELLLKFGANPSPVVTRQNYKSLMPKSPLSNVIINIAKDTAVKGKGRQILKLLLLYKADVNQVDEEGLNAIEFAKKVLKDHLAQNMVLFMLERMPTIKSDTPLKKLITVQ